MEKLRSYRFDLCFDFHEDPDLEADFYMYDSGKLSEQELQRFRTEIQSMGAHLYTGIDTSTDVNLGFSLEQGYASVPQETMSQSSGFLDKWLLDCGLVKRIFTLEIPGKAPLEQKRALVHALFSFFLTMPPANS
ncbi:hypothetical protein A3A38_02085 [Candidatus Kaiserbacteria bacterium RIFCSPLOWO2_01_FULL_53_17]|uniref:Peptidase M14 carboxypeptidase A domain-containing protein n=1 Tax=Candidatus Kaiserbacteria bacterium RIFCSPLOWO2_01_FULL_53_17 TaxID=1798511 RepID=A0A1F6EFP2_9BACT|nr:MAG: hypothetical protein A3A38_02085 [Candidatus Kaiserbacteria bacterium RIFCSPLOWO2_01_FULL_53_17]